MGSESKSIPRSLNLLVQIRLYSSHNFMFKKRFLPIQTALLHFERFIFNPEISLNLSNMLIMLIKLPSEPSKYAERSLKKCLKFKNVPIWTDGEGGSTFFKKCPKCRRG